MTEVSFFLQTVVVFVALLVLIALLRWIVSTGRTARPARRIFRRPLVWVIVVVQILFAAWAGWIGNAADCGADDVCDSYTVIDVGLRVYLVLFLWAIVDVILGAIWATRRTCPRCDHTCRKALLLCPACQFDFDSASAGSATGDARADNSSRREI